jgi:hypothetical protein
MPVDLSTGRQVVSAARSLPPSGQGLASQCGLAQPTVSSIADAVTTSEASANAANVRAPIPNSSVDHHQ